MSPDAVSLLALAAAALELGLAGYYSRAAFAQTLAARRRYLMAHVFACVGFLCLAILALTGGPLIGGLLFAGIAALALGQTWRCWRHYRRLR